MKKLLLLFTLVLVASFGFAAVTTYNWTYTSGGTYTPLSGGTQLGGGSVDDTSYPNIALPFNFVYDGTTYTAISVNANGFIAMGTTVTSSYVAISGGTTNNVIAGLNRDLKARTDGDLRWQVIGTEGSREMVVQWTNYARYQSTITVTDNFNFQIRLQEGTNKIYISYGSITVDALDMASYPEVGIRGASNADFKNRTTTSNWAATTPGGANNAKCTLISTVYPASGSSFVFTPVGSDVAPYAGELVAPLLGGTLTGGASLRWVPNGGTVTGYKLYLGTDGGGTTTPINVLNGEIVSGTSYAPTGLLGGTAHYWKIVPYNGVNDAADCPIWNFVTSTPITGTKIIGTTEPYDYLTFTAAITALNENGVGTGGVTFQVQNGTYAENPPALTASGSADDQIKFQPVTGANPVLTPAGGTGTFGFKLDGADWVTFDNIDVTGPTTLIYGYWLANGAQNNTIKNCAITVPYGSTNYGIYSIGVAGNPNSYCTFLSNAVDGPYNGIYATGSSTAGEEALGVNIQGNTITNIRNYGIYFGYGINGVVQYNNVGCYSGSTTTYYGIYVVGTTTTCSVHHNVLSGGYTSSTVYALYNSSATTTWDSNEVTGPYNTSSSGWYGMYPTSGNTIWTNNSIHGITNSGTAAVYSAYVTTGNHEFKNNEIYDIATGGTSLYGFYVIGGTTHKIHGNKVYNLRYTGAASGIVYGIHLGSGTTTYVYNNMVYDLRATGSTAAATTPAIRAISITGGTTHNVWYNSVYLNSTGTSANFGAAALYVATTSTTMVIDLKNNIFVNESVPGASGKAPAFWRASAAGVGILSAGSDKNIYFTAEPPTAAQPMGYFYATSTTWTTYTTLDEYKTMAVNKDQASYWEDVPYLSKEDPYDLHIRESVPTRIEGNAIVVSRDPGYDIDNDPRSTSMPDIGADEGEFTAVAGAPGNVTLLYPPDETSGYDPNTLTVSWSPSSEGGTPTEYYVFVSNTNLDLDDFFANAIMEPVEYPTTSLQLSTIAELDLGFNATWYWAVQAHNNDDDSNPDDPSFMIWSFTTGPQMTAQTTLNLGNVWPGIEKTGTIPVTNLGGTTLSFDAAGIDFEFGAQSFEIPPNSTFNLPYTFYSPETLGAYTGSITLTETEPGGSVIEIAVTANITDQIIVGNGTTNLYLPVYPFYRYSYSQSIYYPSEISYPAGHRINKVYYYFNGYSTLVHTTEFVIYMGHTDTDVFETTSSWLPISGFQEVYNGVNIAQQVAGGYWLEFILDTPFVYDGVSNLVIAVEENFYSTTYDGSSNYFYSTDTPGINRSLVHYSDSIDADPANPPVPPTTTLALKAGFPNLKLAIEPIPTTPQISVSPSAWDFGSVIIDTEHDKEFTIRNTGGGTLIINSVTINGDVPPFSLVNPPAANYELDANESVTFTVRFAPTAGTVAGTPYTATVSINDNRALSTIVLDGACVDPRITSLPYAQNFDDVVTPAFPLGWTGYKSNTGMSIYTATTNQTPPNSVYMYNSSYTTDLLRLVSPQVTVPIGTIKLSFWARGGTASSTLLIGTVPNADGTGTLNQLAVVTIPTSSVWAQYSIALSNYTGTDQFLCIQHGQGGTYRSFYIDTILLTELVPNDLAATLLAGPSYAIVGTQASYNVTVYNNGTAEQVSYNVHLKRYGDDRYASLPVTTPLAPGATAVHTLNYTYQPGDEGIWQIVGEVELTGDQNSANNETAVKSMGVFPAGTWVEAFDGPTLPGDWTLRTGDAGSYNWAIYATNPLSPPNCMAVRWESSTITNDDWLITPPLQLSSARPDAISFWIGEFSTYTEDYEVRLSTTGNQMADFTVLLESGGLVLDPNGYVQKFYDLDPYGDAVVYIALRYTGLNKLRFYADDFVGSPLYVPAEPEVAVEKVPTGVKVSWPANPYAKHYKIYLDDDPYGNFSGTPVITTGTEYIFTGADAMKFFKVVVSTMAPPAKGDGETAPQQPSYEEIMKMGQEH